MAVGWGKNSSTNTYIATATTTLLAKTNARVTTHDEHGNPLNLEFPHPEIVQVYADGAGVINTHNQMRQ